MEGWTAPLKRRRHRWPQDPPPPPQWLRAHHPGGESRRRLITVAVIFTALAVLGSLALLLRGGEPSGLARVARRCMRSPVTCIASSTWPGQCTAQVAGSSARTRPTATRATAPQPRTGCGWIWPCCGSCREFASDATPTTSTRCKSSFPPEQHRVADANAAPTWDAAARRTQAGRDRYDPASHPRVHGCCEAIGGAMITPYVVPTGSTAQEAVSQPRCSWSTRIPAAWRVVGSIWPLGLRRSGPSRRPCR